MALIVAVHATEIILFGQTRLVRSVRMSEYSAPEEIANIVIPAAMQIGVYKLERSSDVIGSGPHLGKEK